MELNLESAVCFKMSTITSQAKILAHANISAPEGCRDRIDNRSSPTTKTSDTNKENLSARSCNVFVYRNQLCTAVCLGGPDRNFFEG